MNDGGNQPNARVSLRLYRSMPIPCPYLPDRLAVSEGIAVDGLSGAVYEQLMNIGFRRSGKHVYRPACEGCSECVPLRVPVQTFTPSRSQRRAMRRNSDVEVSVGEPAATDEKHAIYKAYLEYQHDGQMGSDREGFEAFLYDRVTETIEMTCRVDGRLIGAGLCDVCDNCLSSVYFYFDPAEHRRSLGTFSVLMEIEECRRRGLPYWYAGFYVRDCPRMNYKASFRPFELLDTEARWRPAERQTGLRGGR